MHDRTGDAMRFVAGSLRDHLAPDVAPCAATGLLAFIGPIDSVYDRVRSQVDHLLNPTAFGFQMHFDVAPSLRRPGNGFVVKLQF